MFYKQNQKTDTDLNFIKDSRRCLILSDDENIQISLKNNHNAYFSYSEFYFRLKQFQNLQFSIWVFTPKELPLDIGRQIVYLNKEELVAYYKNCLRLKGNTDGDLYVFGMTQNLKNFDSVLLLTGDCDYEPIINYYQFKKKKVFLLSVFETTASALCDIISQENRSFIGKDLCGFFEKGGNYESKY